jgi:glycosyltransferase involved in cell wall biosynthesis
VAIAGRGELENALRRRATELGVAARFYLLGLRSDIANVLAGADLFVLPSLSEGVPLALLEAMLAGRPVIASAVGEVPAVLDGGSAGSLVPPGDAAALAQAISHHLDDPASAGTRAAAGRSRATAAYSFDAMVTAYLERYAQALPALGNHPDDAGSESVREGEGQPLPHGRPPGKRALAR